MDTRRPTPVLALLCLGLALGGVASGQSVPIGSQGQLTGTSVLAVKGCGKLRRGIVLDVLIDGGATWSGGSEGDRFTGTYIPAGAGGRKLGLQFDAESEAAFIAAIAEDVAELCETSSVTVESVTAQAFVLKLNRRQTKAKVGVRYRVEGTAAGQRGTARYRMAAKGAWISSPL